jgi:vancomycin resistance protein YoaR
MTWMDTLSGRLASHRALWAVVALVALVLVLGALAFQVTQLDSVFPGVRVAGVDVGGLTQDEAAARLAAASLMAGTLTLRDPEDGRTWPRPAGALGLSVEPNALAEAAFAVGRTGRNPVARVFHPLFFRLTHPTVPVTARFDLEPAAATLSALAPEVDRRPIDASLKSVAGRLEAQPSRLGHQLDVSGTLRALALFATRPVSDTVDIVVQRTAARVPDLGNVARAYDLAVSGPLDVGWRSVARFAIPVDRLKAWVTVRDVPNAQGDPLPTVIFDQAAMARWLEDRRGQIDRPPVNARFTFDEHGALAVLDGGRSGLRLDVPASVAAIEEAAYTDVRIGELVVEETPAGVGPGAVEQMSSLEEISRASTSLVGAPAGRLLNLTLMADRLQGVAVAPGGYLALSDLLGPVDAAAGYDPAFLAATGPDSTVTQMCTTLLRTVWWAGFPILERHAPPERLGWVEPPVGLDCAIRAGEDFRFLNDSDGIIWFEVVMDRDRSVLTVILYAQPLSRVVDTVGPTVTKVVPAPPGRTVPAPALPAGLRVQTQWAREGAEASVSRTVTAGARLLARDTWVSRYAPAPDVVLTGTGSALTPTPAPTAPPTP